MSSRCIRWTATTFLGIWPNGHVMNIADFVATADIDIFFCCLSVNEMPPKLDTATMPTSNLEAPSDATNNIVNLTNNDLSKFKGKNLITGEPIRLESYFDRRRRKSKQDALAAEILEKFMNSSQYKTEASYRKLVNEKIEIGKTADGRRVVGKIKHIKVNKSKNNESSINGLENIDEDINNTNNAGSFAYDDHNIMVNTVENFEEICTSPMVSTTSQDLHTEDAELSIFKTETEFDSLISDVLEEHKYTDLKMEYFEEGPNKSDPILNSLENRLTAFKTEYFKENLDHKLDTNKSDLDLINDILEEHKYTDLKEENADRSAKRNESDFESLINDILEDHRYTDFRLEYFEENTAEGENEYLIDHEEQEDPIRSSYNSLLSMNITAHHNYSRLSKNTKPKSTKPVNDKADATETVNFHEYPKRVLIKRNRKPSKIEKRFYTYRFSCATCKRKFSRPTSLQLHKQYCNNKEKGTYSCSFCGCSYHFSSSLTRHVVQKHVDKATAKFKTDPDQKTNELYSGLPSTDVITKDSIILEEEEDFQDGEKEAHVEKHLEINRPEGK